VTPWRCHGVADAPEILACSTAVNMSDEADPQGSSTRPYLIRALHDWCTDNGYTPLIAVHVDAMVRVPMEFVKNDEIVLNVSFDATSGLRLGNDAIDFKARFGGVARDIVVPVDHVIAIYARENGQGMAFPMPEPVEEAPEAAPASAPTGLRLASAPAPTVEVGAPAVVPAAPEADPEPPSPAPAPAGGRPSLKRIK
jgi:stringent starvation protein B